MTALRKLGTILWMGLGGLVLGGLLGMGLGHWLPVAGMAVGAPLGFSPTTLNLGIVTVTFGLTIGVNMTGLVGLFVGCFLALRR